jgi:hypothetical protein
MVSEEVAEAYRSVEQVKGRGQTEERSQMQERNEIIMIERADEGPKAT